MGAILSVACVGVFVSTHILYSVARAEAGYGAVIRCLLECVGFVTSSSN
jgi:hypothetical protein